MQRTAMHSYASEALPLLLLRVTPIFFDQKPTEVKFKKERATFLPTYCIFFQ